MINISVPIVGVGIMLIDKNNNVLLGSRIKSDEPPTWCFPGGKIDAKESLQQASIRELQEETDLDLIHEIDNFRAFITFFDTYSERVNTTFGLFYQLKNDDLKSQIRVTEPHIFNSWQWFNLKNLPENLFPATEVMLNSWLNQPNHQRWSIYKLHTPSSN